MCSQTKSDSAEGIKLTADMDAESHCRFTHTEERAGRDGDEQDSVDLESEQTPLILVRVVITNVSYLISTND